MTLAKSPIAFCYTFRATKRVLLLWTKCASLLTFVKVTVTVTDTGPREEP
jgi:hypothetical protein